MSPLSDDSCASVVDRLALEFHNLLSRPVISGVVFECREQLCCSPSAAMPELVERLARQRLNTPTVFALLEEAV